MKKIFVIGGSNIDIYAKSHNDLVLKDSNIATIKYSYGGVARNIVENLANLKAKVSFTTVVGNDTFGKDIFSSLTDKGVDMDNSLIIDGANTSSYMAVLNKDDMYVAMCDTKVLDENLKIENIDNLKNQINDEDYVILDTNLSQDILKYIVKNLKGIKVVDSISTNKVVKLFGILDKIDVLKMNKLEAEKISGIEINSVDDIKNIVSNLNRIGVKEAIVTFGSKLYIGFDNKVYLFKHNAYEEFPVNVTGAGDSLLANYIYKRACGFNIDEASVFGLSAAVLTVKNINAVAPLNEKIITENIPDLKIEKEIF